MNWPTIKKYLKYVVIILIAILAIVVFFMIRTWWKKRIKADDGTEHVLKLGDVIGEIQAQFTEANQQAEIEISAGRSEEQDLKDELELALLIKDKPKRRARMVELYEKAK